MFYPWAESQTMNTYPIGSDLERIPKYIMLFK